MFTREDRRLDTNEGLVYYSKSSRRPVFKRSQSLFPVVEVVVDVGGRLWELLHPACWYQTALVGAEGLLIYRPVA